MSNWDTEELRLLHQENHFSKIQQFKFFTIVLKFLNNYQFLVYFTVLAFLNMKPF